MNRINNFIPAWHYAKPEDKLKKEWIDEACKYCWYQTGNHNLLEGKNVPEINGYASGNFSMKQFLAMYKSNKSAMSGTGNNTTDVASNYTEYGQYELTDSEYQLAQNHKLGYVPLPLIPPKLNSGISVINKIPVEVSATAMDALAAKKKKSDLEFLKNKPTLEADLQSVSDQMQAGKVDLGTTLHSAIPFSDSPYGLDLNEPDELQVFVDLLYSLGVEAGFETALQSFWEIKNGAQIKLLEIKDQFKFGVSCHKAFESSVTNLPDAVYVFPGKVRAPKSSLPDYSDNTHRFIEERMTPIDLMNYFSDEICNDGQLDEIINDTVTGYCACNKVDPVSMDSFNTFKINMVYCEIKSVDSVSVSKLNKKSKYNILLDDENDEDEKNCTGKIWGQNTYCFWWLKNTKHYFGIHKLGYGTRKAGQEAFQMFSSNIYKSQEKSGVELCVGENKKAQIADIKMQHAIIMSLPAGKYIDLKYLRSALEGLKKEPNNTYTIQDLINLAFEKNIMIGDTEGFEGKNDGQFKPILDIPGGIKSEVVGYMQVIADANTKIGQFLGINDQLTGQSANSEGLIGLEKLRINASINALNYINQAIEMQYQNLFNVWSNLIKYAVEKGGKSKEAIVNLIGSKKVSLIDSLEDLPLHNMGIKVTISQREEEREEFRQGLNRLKINNVIDEVDEYMLSAVTNPKDKMALLAVKVKQWKKRADKQRAEDMANQQAMIQAQGENQQAAMRAKAQGDIQKIYAQGDTSAKILQLAAQLGIQDKQIDFVGKKALQQDRNQSQIDKATHTLETKQQLENQKSLVA